MLLTMLKAKIANARITQTELYYEGSITIDKQVLEEAGILAGEKVEVLNLNNGVRLETYTIEGEPGSGVVCLNGPAARQGFVGDRIIVLSYAIMDAKDAKAYKPKIVKLKDNNRLA